MTLNREQAQHDNEELYNDAVQSEIGAALSHDGAMHCYRVAQKIGKSQMEARWHLEQMRDRGEVEFSWIKGYSV